MVLECMITERAPQKLCVKLQSVGGKPLRISKMNMLASINYAFLEDIIPPRTTAIILVPDAYTGGRVTVKTLEDHTAIGNNSMVVVEGDWSAHVDPKEPWKPTGAITYSDKIYGRKIRCSGIVNQ